MAYTENKAFELIESAHSRGRLGHAFILSGARDNMESLATRLINLINKPEDVVVRKRRMLEPAKVTTAEPEVESSDDGGGDMFDLFGEVEMAPAPSEEPEKAQGVAEAEFEEEVTVTPAKVAENLEELEGDLVRIIRPHSKSRIIKVDEMRELEKAMYQSADAGKWKVGVVMDADRMQTSAANAFLKTLEEPPSGCLLLLLTNSPERLLPTIISRCVNISIMADGAEREALEGEDEMIKELIRHGKRGFNSVSRALTIKSVFSAHLAKRKRSITKQYENALKEEQNHYKNATDGDWLSEREKYYEALTQSDYLLERSKFIDLLILWLGDLVRIKSGAPKLDFQQHESAMREIADPESLDKLLIRMEALEKLRGMFETNVTEALALEVVFMKAFG